MKRLSKWRLIPLLTVLALVLSGCGEPFLSTLQPAGDVAKEQFDLMVLSTAIMVGVIVVVVLIFLVVILKFRRKNDKIPKQVEGSHKLEIIWTVIPILLLLVLAVPTVASTFNFADTSEMDKEDSDAVVINVRASLYWWEFEYPNEEIVVSQEFVVPTDEKVYFNLKASDVKHSFWIPAIGGKMDTNTENVNRFWLEFDGVESEKAGQVFYGKCAELCGPSHALMDFKVKAVPRAEYEQWISKMQNTTEPEATTELAQQGQEIFNNSCIGCHAVTPANTTPEAARMAPNLTDFGNRERVAGFLENNEENIKKWLEDPELIKPGNKMSGSYGKLTEQELDALTEYLMNLKIQD